MMKKIAAIKSLLNRLVRKPITWRIAVSICLLVVAAWPAMTATAQDSASPSLTVIVEALNVRQGPDVTYPVLAGLQRDDTVQITGHSAASGWWQIQLADGRAGWVSGGAAYVQVKGATTAVPELAAPVASTAPITPTVNTPAGGRLVFQTASGGPIYIINADGTGLHYLTTGLDPALSPDGQWVAFARWDSPGFGGSGSIWLIRVDGSGEQMILGGITAHPKSPTWSPDGQRLAFSMQLVGGHGEVIRVCREHAPPPEGYDVRVRVKPSGDLEYCFKLPPESFWGLRVVDVTTGEFQDLPHGLHAFSPTWDPANPAHLVYVDEQGLVSLDMAQDANSLLAADPLDHSPAFSPDGQRLVVTYLQHDHWEVHVLNADGSNRTRLTETSIIDIVEQRLQGLEPRISNNVAATWSPDGSQIAFLSDRSGQWDIWVMNGDGSQQRPMFAPDTLAGISFAYDNMDERMLSWR